MMVYDDEGVTVAGEIMVYDDEGVTVPEETPIWVGQLDQPDDETADEVGRSDPVGGKIPTEMEGTGPANGVEVMVPGETVKCDIPSQNSSNCTAYVIAASAGLVVFVIWLLLFVDLLELARGKS
jgi:hypothetical protein